MEEVKQIFRDAQREFSAMDEEKKWEAAWEITAASLVGLYYWKAKRAAKRGEWNRAIFFALLWIGTANNINNERRRRAEKRSLPRTALNYHFNSSSLS